MGLGTSGVGCYLHSGEPKSISDLDTAFGWVAPGSEVDLRDMVQELQGIRVSSIKFSGQSGSTLLKVRSAGGVSAVNAMNTITQDDVIFGCVEFVSSTTRHSGIEWISLRNDVRIAATAGYVSISGKTAGGAAPAQCYYLLFWLDKSGYGAY